MAQKFFRFPFADSGDKTAIPDIVQPDGTVSYAQGWSPDYQLPKTNPQAKDIERDKTNSLMNDITGAIQILQVHGVPDWITSADNGGSPYSYDLNAIVRYSDGKVYRSMVATNTATPGANTDWSEDIGRLLAERVFVVNGTYTPTPGTRFIDVEAWGGSGGSGGLPATSGSQNAIVGGGGSGSYGRGVYFGGFAGATITIGAAGVAGGVGGAGGNGGSTSLGSLITAPGGNGSAPEVVTAGSNALVVGGLGGISPTGANLLSVNGERGSPGFVLSNSLIGGDGGSAACGGTGAPGSGTGTSGAVGIAPGGGAGGGGNYASLAGRVGSAGAIGRIIIREYA